MEFFGFFLDFFGGLGFFWEDLFGRISLGGFFGRIFLEDFFGKIFLGGCFEEIFVYIVKVH